MATAVQEQVDSGLQGWLESFTEAERQAPGRALPWLRKLREDGFARFYETGFPTTHDEDWRFTNIAGIARTVFRVADAATIAKADAAEWIVEGAAARLVFVNGRFVPSLSALKSLPKGVTVASLREQIEQHPETVEKHLGRYADTQRDAFVALNTAFLGDGAYVHVARGVVVHAPICLLYLSTQEETPSMTHPRNLIVAEDASQVTVVEDYGSVGGECVVLSNAVTELVAGESTVAQHFLIEREHLKAFNISTLRIEQGRSANVSSHSVLLGGGLVRNNVHPVLAGEGGECLINGLFLGTGRQHLDNFMHVEHAAPHCGSRQFYNGILDGQAHGVFHGRIVVHKPAQKTDAKQTNRNLLLSDDAQIDTKPQLEIYADDVKCTHGATIGQIEENALFYLQSRGISEKEARNLLLMAFAEECVGRMHEGAIREHVEKLIQQHPLFSRNTPRKATGVVTERNWEERG
ncbi:MAG TPA: Fe-S cluster assembly protein SufD [Acidobacteriaceae bacterium]|jgi:Fe-S cluster assembly protein SufD|nr:Fe-S cluster assembly protein SufD [Acidobacteriaceae bacterium]